MAEPSPASQRRAVAVAIATGLAPLLVPLLVGRVFTRDDLAALHLPFRFLYQRALVDGHLLWWTDAYHSGFFIHGAGETGITHPLHLALYRFLPLGPAFNLEIIASYVFLLIGTTLFMKRLGLSTDAALFGGATFAFGSFNIFNLMHVNHIATFAHAPWMLLFTHRIFSSANPRGVAMGVLGLIGAAGSQWLTGNPQYVVYTMLAIGFLALCLLIDGQPRTRALLVAAGVVAGAAIGGIQLLPSIAFFQDSARASWTLDQSLTFSLMPINLVQLVAPFAFQLRIQAPPDESQIVHEFIVYNGAFCTVAMAWIALRWNDLSRRRLVIAAAVAAAASLVLAFGKYGGVYPLIAQLPIIQGLRAPSRHLVLFQLALSVIAAVAIEDLFQLTARRRSLPPSRLWPLAIPAALTIVITTTTVALSKSSWAAEHGFVFSSLFRAAPFSIVILAMIVLVFLAGSGARWAVIGVVVLAAIDQAAWGNLYNYNWGPIRSVDQLRAEARVPAEAQSGDLIPVVPGNLDHLAILRGLRLTSGYTGLMPKRTLDPDAPETQRLAGVNWIGDGDRWTRVADAFPTARHEPRGGTTAISAMWSGHLEIDSNAESPRTLVTTERFHPGWRVTIDGTSRPTMQVHDDFLGVAVDSGAHHVVLDFAPDSVRLGLILTSIGIALAAVLVGSLLYAAPRNAASSAATDSNRRA